MKIIVLVSLFIPLVTSESAPNSCTGNQFCVAWNICPMFRKYKDQVASKMPEAIWNMAKPCKWQIIDGDVVVSVCCPSWMNSEKCGTQSVDKIANGQVAQLFEFPWMVLLRDSSGKFVCGGTLISPRFVLTAAHCVLERVNIKSVRLGEYDITRENDCNHPEDCPPPQDISVNRIIRHPGYSERYKINDIALLRLAKKAKLGISVRTICLPNGSPEPKKGMPKNLTVAGWGLTEQGTSSDVLRFAQVPLMSWEDCAPRVKSLGSRLTLNDSQVCAGGVDMVDNCRGDSGGPLKYVHPDTSKYIQFGVVSYGVKTCGVESEPGVYTKVEYFIDWIFKHVDE